MEKNKIKVIDTINSFKFITREWKAIEGIRESLLSTKSEEATYYRIDALISFYTQQEKYIEQNIYWNLSTDTRILELNQDNFSQDLLDEIINCFCLVVKKHSLGHKYLNPPKNNLYHFSPTVSIKKSEGANVFFIIYYFDDGDSRKYPELFVYGIWEVELSEDFKDEIFNRRYGC